MNAKGKHNQTWFRRVVVTTLALGVTLLMSGCGVDMFAYYLGETATYRQAFIKKFTSDQPDRFYNMAEVAGKYYALIDQGDLKVLITDEKSFLTYALGIYLAWHPDMTYDELLQQVASGGGNAAQVNKEMSREEFEYYRAAGKAWADSLIRDPENRIMVERMELFRQRMGTGVYTSETDLNPWAYKDLLNNGEQLERFLTDDRYATEWLRKNYKQTTSGDRGPSMYGLVLGPIYTGVTPGTGS